MLKKKKLAGNVIYQNWEVRAGGEGKCASSAPMLSKNSPVKLFPLITGMLDGAIHPISANPITFRSLRSQSLSKLHSPTQNQNHNKQPIILQIGQSLITYQVNLPPDARATARGFLAASGDLTNPGKTRKMPKINYRCAAESWRWVDWR